MENYIIGDNTYVLKKENGEDILESKRDGFTVRCRFINNEDDNKNAIIALKEYLANIL